MPTSHRARRKAKDDRCWCRQAVLTAAAMGWLLQPAASFLTHHVHVASHRHSSSRGALRSSSVTTAAAMSATPQPQHSTAAEAVHPVPLESPAPETDARKRVRSLAEAKKELLERVGFGVQSPGAERPQSDEERVGYLLEVLEGNYKPILTIGFFNFAAQGDWDLAYTNAAMLPIGPRLKVYEQFQRIEPGDGVKGSCTNILAWRLLDEGIDGRLEVGSEYEFDPRGWMNSSLLKHRLIPDGNVPSDPEALVRILQRAMPHELFDPDEHAMETTFLDDTMRIVRVRGPKFEGRLNIFVRRRNSNDHDNEDDVGDDAQVDGVQANAQAKSEATASEGS